MPMYISVKWNYCLRMPVIIIDWLTDFLIYLLQDSEQISNVILTISTSGFRNCWRLNHYTCSWRLTIFKTFHFSDPLNSLKCGHVKLSSSVSSVSSLRCWITVLIYQLTTTYIWTRRVRIVFSKIPDSFFLDQAIFHFNSIHFSQRCSNFSIHPSSNY